MRCRQPNAVSLVAQALALALALALAFGHATRMATLREWPRYANGHATRMATLCERRCEVTQHYSNAYLFYSKADS
ncbi:hypothetical protein [Moorena sp. SIOASIH]|uniref:hypothetical protein n=1 Tax=Moorena sp. SIOASIH TaxID=2607817 RepID=UPI0025DD4F62|nr:hypothetical protein [Moorena sp. SIOASIH]